MYEEQIEIKKSSEQKNQQKIQTNKFPEQQEPIPQQKNNKQIIHNYPRQQQQQQSLQITKNKPPLRLPAHQQSKQQTQILFTAAYSQRKTMNINKIRQYMQKRMLSYQERAKIFDLLRSKMYDKQKMSKKLIESIIRYFIDYSQLLKYLLKAIVNKLELKSKNKNRVMLAAIQQAIQELSELNQNQCKQLEGFIDWLDKVLVQAFKSAESYYKDRVKKLSKDLEKTDHTYYDFFDKQQKFYQKLSQGDDLLEKQLMLMQKIKQTDQAVINRGTTIYEAWESLLEQERSLKKILKQNILQFHQRYIKFHKKAQPARNLHKYWSNLPQTPDAITIYQSILTQKQISFICYEHTQTVKIIKNQAQPAINSNNNNNNTNNSNNKSKQILAKQHKERLKKLSTNFQLFLRLKHQQLRVGNPYPFLQILVVKKFKSKIQKSHREWKNIRLIFTIDRNLLFEDEIQGKCLIKIVQNTIKIKRVSENILEIVGTELGFIIDSTKKQSIHFQTLDEVEEFVYFVEGLSNAQK